MPSTTPDRTEIPIIVALIEERERQGMSMRELARKSGVSIGALCEIESGKHGPTLKTTYLLAYALGLDLAVVPDARRL